MVEHDEWHFGDEPSGTVCPVCGKANRPGQVHCAFCGTPLFGQSGRVIGVNYATFTEMADQNYAVPIRFAYPLLERAGWKRDEPTDEQTANANTATPKEARPPASNQLR